MEKILKRLDGKFIEHLKNFYAVGDIQKKKDSCKIGEIYL